MRSLDGLHVEKNFSLRVELIETEKQGTLFLFYGGVATVCKRTRGTIAQARHVKLIAAESLCTSSARVRTINESQAHMTKQREGVFT